MAAPGGQDTWMPLVGFLSQLEATPAEGTAPLGLAEGRKEGRTGRLEHKFC